MSNVRPPELLSMPLTILPVHSLSFNSWRALWLQYAGSNAAVDPVATFARLTNPELNLYGIAAVSDSAVGFAHFYYHASTWSETENCCLQDLYVSPSMRGQKVGRTLVEAVASEARTHGASVLHWRTKQSNISANALYAQFAERTDYVSYRLVL